MLTGILLCWLSELLRDAVGWDYYSHPSRGYFSVLNLALSGFAASFAAAWHSRRYGLFLALPYGLLAAILGLVTIALEKGFASASGAAAIALLISLGGGVLGESLARKEPACGNMDTEDYDRSPLTEKLFAIENRLAAVESGNRLTALEVRLKQLEEAISGKYALPAAAAAAPNKADEVKSLKDLFEKAGPVSQPAPDRAAEGFKLDENFLAGRVLERVGIVLLVLGVAFFLKYAIDNQWVGPMGRVIGGILCGIGLLIGGERLSNRRFAGYGQTLMGGGLAVLYLSFYGGFHFYKLIPQLPALLLMIMVTITGVALSVRCGSRIVAYVGILGGFLTPMLMSTGVISEVPLFTHLTLLDAGILILGVYMNWRELSLVAFVCTQMWLQTFMQGSYKPGMLSEMWFFTSALFAVFLAISLVRHLRRKVRARAADLALLIANPFCYYWTAYYRFLEGSPYVWFEAYFAVIIAVIFLLTAQLAFTDNADDRYLGLSLLGLGASFISIALPVAFDWQWVTMGYATEAGVLLWLGLRMNDKLTRFAAAVCFAAAAVRLVGVETELHEEYALLISGRGLCFAYCLAVIGWAQRQYRSAGQNRLAEGAGIAAVYGIAWNLLLLLWLSVEAVDYWRHSGIPSGDVNDNVQITLSIVWTLYSFILMGYGIARYVRAARILALCLFALTTAKVFIVDMAGLSAGLRMFSFLGLGSLLLLASYNYQRCVGGRS
ncbi:MAG: DUF2339 domain-containing protein [Elusimicrobia bacterium]|nr:DUF2339 domain-containing protein [Elusimicrobiota bacterium]